MRYFSWVWTGVVLVTGLGLAAQTAEKAHPTTVQPVARQVQLSDNPVADPKAVVTIGNARFTILTPQLIRMEWSADGKFEDHASLVFINRRLPVPKFHESVEHSMGNRTLATLSTMR